jgi:hypothetical protein
MAPNEGADQLGVVHRMAIHDQVHLLPAAIAQQPTCRRSPETGEDDQRTSGMTISEVRVLLSS